MIGKLIKYEFRATWKYMCILFLCVCIISAGIFAAVEMNKDKLVPITDDLGNVLDYVSESWAYGVVAATFLMMVVLVLVICFGVARFKRVLTAEDGYFVNTLPVSAGSIILSKAITFFVYALPLVGLTFIFFFRLFLNSGGSMIAGRMGGEIAIATNGFNPTGEQILNFAMSSAKNVVSGVLSLFQIYAAMAIGFSFNRHKGMWSFGAFFAIAFGIEFMAEVFTPIRNRIYNLVSMQYEGIIELIIETAIVVIFFFIIRYFMKNRLNLD